MPPSPHAPDHGPSRWTPREAQALAELASTPATQPVRWFLCGLFVMTMVVVPLVDTGCDVAANVAVRQALLAAGTPNADLPGRRPYVLSILDKLPLPTAAELRSFEDRLAKRSAVAATVRPWWQWALTASTGGGSNTVRIDPDGWYYYHDGLVHTAEAFLDPARLKRLGVGADPRPAIIQFRDLLRLEGVDLLVVPVPDKSAIRPPAWTGHRAADGALQSPSWHVLLTELREAGVRVVDMSDALIDVERRGGAAFLQKDSHWAPAGLSAGAAAVAAAIRLVDTTAPTRNYTARSVSFAHRNDLVRLLGVPSARAARLGTTVSVEAQQVIDAESGRPWQSDEQSTVLLVGDSFAKTFSLGDGEGLAAGFAEHISLLSTRAVERRANQDLDQYDTRGLLGNTQATVRASARGRRLVVWEFAARKLTVQAWPLLP